MIRYLSAILLITAFAAQTFNGAFIKLGYYINPDAFAKNCVNKAKPKLKCHGKCQVMKKMQEEEKREQENQERKWENKITVLSSKSFFTTDIQLTEIPLQNQYGLINLAKEVKMPRSIFHPPASSLS